MIQVLENEKLNFMKIEKGYFLHKQIELKNNMYFMRLKKRPVINIRVEE